MRVRTFAVAVAVVAALAAPSFAQNPVGVWKINVAKSKYSPGPAPKAGTITTTAVAGGSFKTVNEQTPATGAPIKFEITFKFDGTDAKVIGNNPNADTQSYTRVDDRHWTVVSKKNGKVTLTSKIEVAADGKSRTTTQTGTDAQGRAVNNVIWYDKQ
jgi:hypothetical protein